MLNAVLRRTAPRLIIFKNFHASSLSRLREIFVEKKDEQTTVIGAKLIKSPRKPYLLKLDDKSDKCPLCQLQLDLRYTDVLILSQFINSKGEILPKSFTSLCNDQYKLVKELIYMAQHAGLLPEPSKEEPKKPYQLLNTYYDEKTIVLHPKRKKHETRLHYLKLGATEKLRVKPHEGLYYGKK